MNKIVYATVARRLGAYLIDAFISLVMMIPLLVWYSKGLFSEQSGLYLLGYGVLLFSMMLCIRMIYLMIGWHSKKGTIGCRITHISVISLEGNPPTFLFAFIRYLGFILSIGFLGLGFISILFTNRHQGIADLLSNTIVVQKTNINS